MIGARSAGCVVANRLTADGTTTVLLLEAGGPDANPAIHVPPAWPTLFGTDVDWAYQTEEEPFLERARVPAPRGKVLGGTSSINAMVYVRGNRTDYDNWWALGNSGWGYEEVLPYFKRSEDQARGADAFHGIGGPLHVSDLAEPSAGSLAFLRAAEAAGHPPNPDFNGAHQDGSGLYQVTIKGGRRQSTAVAFLNPVRSRANLTAETGSSVGRIVFEGTRAVGVAYTRQGAAREARARREIVLACGAIDSPKLLMLSGVGPADRLRALNIPVVADLPGVGENLQDHPMIKVVFRTAQPLPVSATSNLAEAGAFLYTGVAADDPAPDVQLHFAPLPWPHPRFAFDGPGFTIAVNVSRPHSRGRIGLRSADPTEPPVIHANYLTEPADLRRMVRGLEIAGAIGSHPMFTAFSGTALAPAAGTSGAALDTFARQACETIWHPVGTCKMGTDDRSVVGPNLRVHGIEGLRVADASVMPVITTGNTNAPSIMIGEKASDLVRAG